MYRIKSYGDYKIEECIIVKESPKQYKVKVSDSFSFEYTVKKTDMCVGDYYFALTIDEAKKTVKNLIELKIQYTNNLIEQKKQLVNSLTAKLKEME